MQQGRQFNSQGDNAKNPANDIHKMGAEKFAKEEGANKSSDKEQSDVQGGIGGVVTSLRDNAGDFAKTAQDTVSQAATSLKEYGSEYVETAGSWIKRNPGPALLAGFGAGILAGLFLRRR